MIPRAAFVVVLSGRGELKWDTGYMWKDRWVMFALAGVVLVVSPLNCICLGRVARLVQMSMTILGRFCLDGGTLVDSEHVS